MEGAHQTRRNLRITCILGASTTTDVNISSVVTLWEPGSTGSNYVVLCKHQ